MDLEQLQKEINRIQKFLPNIRPLQNFLHLNMFPDLLHERFFDVLKMVGDKYSTIPFPEITYYQKLYKEGKILKNDLVEVMANPKFSTKEVEEYMTLLFANPIAFSIPEKGQRPVHRLISEKLGQSINELTEPILIRFLANYFDQGISYWNTPYVELGIWDCFIELNLNSKLPIYPLNKKLLLEFKNKSILEIINTIVNRLITNPDLKLPYIEASILSLKGWASFVKTIEVNPKLLIDERKSNLLEFVALRLLIDYAWITKLNSKIIPLSELSLPLHKEVFDSKSFLIYEIWQKALEINLLKKTLTQLQVHQKEPTKESQFKFQAIFCIDDRECLLRRNLEKQSDLIETFGTPGHFGLDFNYKESKNSYPIKSCPAPLTANYLIKNKIESKNHRHFRWQLHRNQNIFFDFYTTFKDGLKSGFDLFVQTLVPLGSKNPSLVHVQSPLDLEIFYDNGGYTKKIAAQRIAAVLQSIGLTQNFKPFVFIIGHGSTTTNNPYFKAYGCGACSGRKGDVNASVFVEMINDSIIRDLLKNEHSIDIPDTVVFIAAFHDTSREEVTLYLPDHLKNQDKICEFRFIMEETLLANAKERAKDFASINPNLTAKQSHYELAKRSLAIFEPRPELGHTNNAFTIIGNRLNTRSFSFNRRAFLQSYNGIKDRNGEILEGILSATFPVCGGISLDYFFSRINNRDLAAGSKLSQNVIGLFGLGHGTEDDLLAGLANQMIELHEPCRNIFIIEQSPEVLKLIFKRNTNLSLWALNQWIILVCLDPKDQSIYQLKDSNFEVLSL